MATLRVINLAVRFFLELAALAAFAYWSATLPAPTAVRVVFTIFAPIGVAFLWGMFISPKAPRSTGRAGQAGLGLVVFLAAAATLLDRGHVALAVAFGSIAVVSSLVLYALPQGASPRHSDERED